MDLYLKLHRYLKNLGHVWSKLQQQLTHSLIFLNPKGYVNGFYGLWSFWLYVFFGNGGEWLIGLPKFSPKRMFAGQSIFIGCNENREKT